MFDMNIKCISIIYKFYNIVFVSPAAMCVCFEGGAWEKFKVWEWSPLICKYIIYIRDFFIHCAICILTSWFCVSCLSGDAQQHAQGDGGEDL